jgi:hypothetical protein
MAEGCCMLDGLDDFSHFNLLAWSERGCLGDS